MNTCGYHFRALITPTSAADVLRGRAASLSYAIADVEQLSPRFGTMMLAGTIWFAYERGGDLLQVLGFSAKHDEWRILVPQMSIVENLFASFGPNDPSVRAMTRTSKYGPLSIDTTATQDLAFELSWDGVGFTNHSQKSRELVFPIDIRRCLGFAAAVEMGSVNLQLQQGDDYKSYFQPPPFAAHVALARDSNSVLIFEHALGRLAVAIELIVPGSGRVSVDIAAHLGRQ